MRQIRPIAICVFLKNNKILVSEGYDPVKNEYFYRPLGGGIEFGESSKGTICRELMEEINVEVDEATLTYLGTIENIFTFNGNQGHEIVMIYDGVLKDSETYEQTLLLGKEATGEEVRALWKNLDEFSDGKSILYPTGLMEILVAEASHDSEG